MLATDLANVFEQGHEAGAKNFTLSVRVGVSIKLTAFLEVSTDSLEHIQWQIAADVAVQTSLRKLHCGSPHFLAGDYPSSKYTHLGATIRHCHATGMLHVSCVLFVAECVCHLK